MILQPLSLPACPSFERRNSVIVRPSNIIFAPKLRIYYQNICILPRKIPMNIQITYFRTWNSQTFRRFQLSAILFAFLQTNHDHFFWKISTFYYFLSNYIIKIFWEITLTTNEIIDLTCVIVCMSSAGFTLGTPQNRQMSWTAATVGTVSRDWSHEPHEKG